MGNDWLTDELMQRASKLIQDIDGIASQGTVYVVSWALYEAEKRGREEERERCLGLVASKKQEADDFLAGVRMGGNDNWSARGGISACNDLAAAIRSGQ